MKARDANSTSDACKLADYVLGLPETQPVPMLLMCPTCGARHIDEGEFATKPHHTHACQSCGMCWRPAIVPTCGVQFLPGFKTMARTAAKRCLGCGVPAGDDGTITHGGWCEAMLLTAPKDLHGR